MFRAHEAHQNLFRVICLGLIIRLNCAQWYLCTVGTQRCLQSIRWERAEVATESLQVRKGLLVRASRGFFIVLLTNRT